MVRLYKNILLSLLAILSTGFFYIATTDFSVSAWYCAGSKGQGCAPTCIESKNGVCVKWRTTGNCNVNLQGDDEWCDKGGERAACGCFSGDCDEAGGLTCSNAGQVCSCSCEPVSCPPGVPPNKFMTKPVTQGYGVSCGGGGCDGSSYACPPVHRNNAPTCSVLPNSITMTREDNPKDFTLRVNDSDYGDSVEVTGVKVVDGAGNLNSCVNITGLEGQSLINSVVRVGSDDASKLIQDTVFRVDAREAHGIYKRQVDGSSVCAGTLMIEIRDLDSDGPSGPDKSDTVSCNVAVSVTNQAPQLKSVKLFDRDENQQLRFSDNLINGSRAQVAVGSTAATSTKSRASFCKEALSLTNPIKCPSGGEEYLSSRHNPLLLEFTVSDANSADDIMQAGVWLELNRTGVNPNMATLPLTNANSGATTRYNFQALYSEKESHTVAGTPYFIQRACLSPACGPVNLSTSSKQIFSGLALISLTDQTGSYVGAGSKVGNLLEGTQQTATSNEWNQVGFPDCLLTSTCTAQSVPVSAKSIATSDNTKPSNYAWSIGSDSNTMLCYPSDRTVPKVVAASTPTVCPANCAACIKKEGTSIDAANKNDMTFKFGIYFNDNEAGTGAQGMPAGGYSIFVSALDKVGVRLGGYEVGGADGWMRFNRSGVVCNGACDSNFSLLYDPIAPTVSFNKWTYTAEQLDTITATGNVTDNTGGSGVSGISNRYIARGQTLDGEPLGEYDWAFKIDGVTPFNGSNDLDNAFVGGAVLLQGKGLQADESIVVGACAFDNAGNMGCGKNNDGYTFLSAWLKTSFGDVFSARGGSAPYAMTIPSNTNINGIVNTDNTSIKDAVKSPNISVYAPFNEQVFTGATGAILTSGSGNVGLAGGYVASTNSTVSLPLGFKGNYRDGGSSQRYNVFGVSPLTLGNEFERTRAAALLNCDLMNESSSGKCQTNGTLSTVGQAEYNILNTGTATIDSLVCNKVNVIFVTGVLTVKGDVTKADNTSGCMFVLANGAAITIEDVPSNVRTTTTDGKGIPYVDKFQAAVVANSGAQISTKKAATQAANKSIDRLEITGWIYSADTAPNFLRSLASVDNRRYPAEWIVYDATLLDLFRPLLGSEKTVDLTCGTSEHILCSTVGK
ncbi:hypothetical protein IT418_02855 [bacterium]|nr:hypothetical protein [bacterium]